MRKAGAASGAATVREAQGLANDVLLREATRNLVDRDTGLFDAEIIESELDIDPAILDFDAFRCGGVLVGHAIRDVTLGYGVDYGSSPLSRRCVGFVGFPAPTSQPPVAPVIKAQITSVMPSGSGQPRP